jgi:hypothetical protein
MYSSDDICAIIRRTPKKDPEFQQGLILDSHITSPSNLADKAFL